MRAQFFDGFNFNDRKYSIVAIERPEELFSIKDVPIRPTMFDESCIRGWSAIYTLSDGKQLILSRLFTNNGDEPAPALYGVEPVSFHLPAGDLQYNLNLSLTYTGSFLIAYDFIHEYFMPFGFQLPHAFKTVFELSFENGIYTHVESRSEAARQLRINYEPPVNSRKKMQLKFGTALKGKSQEHGFDDEIISQFMDISYDTKYLF